MMARSGGFNVPADYFRSSAMPAPVPASPTLPRKRWPLYATIAAVGTGVALMGVVMARSGSSPAQTPPVASAVAAPALSAAPAAVPLATTVTATATPAATVAPLMHEVLVSVSPGDATVSRDGSDLGPAPIALHLAEGESAILTVARKGYKTRTVKVDDRTPRQLLTLDLTGGSAPKPAAAPAAGGIDDVGDPFAKKH